MSEESVNDEDGGAAKNIQPLKENAPRYTFSPAQQLVVDTYRGAVTAADTASATIMRTLLTEPNDFVALQPYTDGRLNPNYERTNPFSLGEFLHQQFEDGQVLDVASGGIELRNVLPTEQVTYADIIPPDQLDMTPAESARYVEADAAALPFPDGSFGGVYNSNFLHRKNASTYLPEMLRVLREDGVLVINPRGSDETMREIMEVLATLGVDARQATLTCSQSTVRHREKPLTLVEKPEIFLSVRKRSTQPAA